MGVLKNAVVKYAAIALIAAIMISPACIASSNAVDARNVTIKVYPDASVKFLGNVTVPNASVKGNLNITLLANLSVLKKGFKALLRFKLLGKPKPVNTSVKGLKGLSRNVTVYMTLKFNGASHITREVAKTLTSIRAYVNVKGALNMTLTVETVKPLNNTIIRKGMISEQSGVIKIGYKGKNAIMLAIVLSLLNKNYVERQLRKNNITWVEIKELRTTTTPSGALIRFDEVINYSKMLTYLSKRNVSKEAIEKLRKGFENLFTPQNMVFGGSLNVNGGTGKPVRVVFNAFLKSDIEPFKEVSVILKSASAFTSLYMINTQLASGFKGAINASERVRIEKELKSYAEYIELLSKTLSRFELLPSNGYLLFKLVKGEAFISFETPKIRAKGAKSPADTLMALARAAINLSNYISKKGERAGKSTVGKALKELIGGKAVIVGVKGVKVNRREVPLTKLGEVKVIILKVTTPLTTSKGHTIRTVVGTRTLSTATTIPSTSSRSTTTSITTSSSTTSSPATSTSTSKSLTTRSVSSSRTSLTTTSSLTTTASLTTSTATPSTTSASVTSRTSSTAAGAGVSSAVIAGVVIAIAAAIGACVALVVRRRH